MLRAIREIQPRWVVGENVLGLVNWNGGLVFEEVQADLEAEGYEVQPFILPAASVNAPHRRDRVWFVASNSNNGRRYEGSKWQYNNTRKRQICTDEQNNGDKVWCDIGSSRGYRYASDTNDTRLQGSQDKRIIEQIGSQRNKQFARCIPSTWENFPTQPPIRSGDDGLPTELDGITFPKWRNESIKAYGNAVVPQVVYEIFKAIEQYERN